jgi:glycosyltransferase involved in cell wall biosynthesis
MKKIVIDARELRTSTGRYVERLLNYLQEVDTDLSHRYIVLLKPKDMDSWSPKSKRFAKLACRWKEFSFGEQLGFAWQLYWLGADLVHFPMVQQPILYQKKVVTTMQDLTTLRFVNPTKNKLIFKFKQYVYHWVNMIVARKSRALITPTEFVKDDVAKYTKTNSRKITVTLEAVDPFDEKPQPIPEFEGRRFIMFNGRPQPHKNLRRLIRAFAQLHEKYPDLYLMIAGRKDKSHRSYTKLANSLGVGEFVVLTDFIPDGQLKWAMQHTEAYVYPSLSEGFGLPPLEAMLNGAPVVASNATCIPEVCGDAAHYFDPYDIDDMVKKIDDVLKKPELRKSLIAKGAKQVTKFSWRRMAEQTLEVYKSVLHED